MKTRAAMERDGEVEPTKRRAAWWGVDAKQRIINLMSAHHQETGMPPSKLYLTAETERDLERLPVEALGDRGIELFLSLGVRRTITEIWGGLFGLAVVFDATEDRVE